MSLLSIVQDAAVRVGLSPPATVASSSALQDKQWLALANAAGREIARWHDWTALSVPVEVVGDGTTTAWDMPADFDRFAYGQKIILDGGVGEILSGPISPAEITLYRARSPITVSYIFYRRGNALITGPALGSGQVASFEYQTKHWATTANGATSQPGFTLDTDTHLFPDDDVLVDALIWMWRRTKGFDYAQEYETWRQHCQLMAGRDRSLTPVANGPAITNLPEPVTPDTIIVTGS